jgi:hypothetical protein
MATAEVVPVIDSAGILDPGISEAESHRDPVLPKQQGNDQHPPSNVVTEVIRPADAPIPRPSRVLFGALKDPVLHLLCPIPLDVSGGESAAVVVRWAEIDELGSGSNLSEAIDDFGNALRELYKHLYSEGIKLGADLQRVKQVLGEYIELRPKK